MSTVAYRFVGQPGDHHYGVPARDLTAEDLARLSEAQRATVARSVLYEAVAPATGTPATEKGKGR